VFTLKLLGGACLEGADGPLTGRVTQRRRLAVLALLAMSRRQGLGREKLAATLWPESDGDRARHLLSDTVYVINRALGGSGGDAVIAAAGELRLRSGAFACDARAFEDAVDSGALENAVRLYTGPFLDGFFVEGNEEFERWACAERERLHDLYGRTLERLATDRADRSDLRGALECWRRLASDDSLNSRVACQLAEAMDRTGDRGGALQQMQAHVATLKEELGIAAPQDVSNLIRALRAAHVAPVPTAADEGPAPTASVEPVEQAGPAGAAGDDASPLRSTPEAALSDARLPAQAIPTSQLVRRQAYGRRVTDVSPAIGRRLRPRSRLVLVGSVVAIVLVVVAVAVRVMWPRQATAVTAATVQSVAVLPFADLSPARDQEYFGDGIAEELSTRLARVSGLKVAARTSAFAFKGKGTDAKEIGRALKVDALVEGSVRQAGGRVRIDVRLIDTRQGYQIWARSWDRGGSDVLAMQGEVATGVLSALRSTPTVAGVSAGSGSPGAAPIAVSSAAASSAATWADSISAAPPAVELEAYNLYLKGRYYWHQRTRESLTKAAEAFTGAAALSPDCAESYSGIADAYAVLGFYDHLPPSEAFPRAKAAAQRALQLDGRLAQPHASLGYVALYYDWDWKTAEREFDRALELNPSYSTGHQWRGNYLVARGRFDEAEAAMRRAQEIDPLSLIASAALGWAQFHRGNFDAAAQQCQRTIELNANFEPAWLWGGLAHEGAGRHAEALRMLKRAAELSNRSPVTMTALGRSYALSGDTASARRIADSLRRGQAGYVPSYEMAKLYLALGDRAEALAWLRRAYDQRSHSLVFLAIDPQLEPLRSDREFRDLLLKTGVSSF
jgi:TolB-like protein/DNA-binding SARP family transcriptional activator/tetratricopeptide (TPR) repeat protein